MGWRPAGLRLEVLPADAGRRNADFGTDVAERRSQIGTWALIAWPTVGRRWPPGGRRRQKVTLEAKEKSK